MKIMVINGPNLNILDKRTSEIYGGVGLEEIINLTMIKMNKIHQNLEVEWFQSNCEGEIVSKIQSILLDINILGLIINPGAYSHTSLAISDSLEVLKIPKIEVHLSNIHKRSSIRHKLLTAKNCDIIISGLKKDSYYIALMTILHLQEKNNVSNN
jgi:3-dehydroquinate dehydratase-2